MPPSLCLPLCFVVVLPPLGPKASDLARFPPAPVVKEELARCKAFLERLDRLPPLDLSLREIELLRGQAELSLKVWDVLDDAHNADAAGGDPAYALGRLLELLGAQAYLSGRFLPWLPDVP